MLTQYKSIFASPGTVTFTLAGLIGRLAYSLMGMGIITGIVNIYDDNALAATVSSTFVFAYALINPIISRFIDKYGQSKVLNILLFTSPLNLVLLAAACLAKLPPYTLFLFAILASPLPNISALTRTRWAHILNKNNKLSVAFSLESVLDEASFVIGPALAIFLNNSFSTVTSIILSACLMGISILMLLMTKATQPKMKPNNHYKNKLIIKYPGIWLVISMVTIIGYIAGSVDNACVIIAKENGNPNLATLPVVIYALISCLAGLYYGTLKVKQTQVNQLLFTCLGTSLTAFPMVLAHSIKTLSVAVFFAGLFFAPTVIVANQIIENRIPYQQLTQALSWLSASLAVGVAIGGGITGIIAGKFGAHYSLYSLTIVGTLIIIFWIIGYKQLASHQINSAASHH